MGKAGVTEGAGHHPLAGTPGGPEGARRELPAQSMSPPDPVHLPYAWSWPGSDRRRLRQAPSVWRVESIVLIWSPTSYSESMTVCAPCCARKERASLLPPVLRGGSVWPRPASCSPAPSQALHTDAGGIISQPFLSPLFRITDR